MSYESQSADAGRHQMPDLVRVMALIGIAVVNVGLIAYPMSLGYLDGGLRTSIDVAAFWSVAAFFMFKSYTLFSFMFGVGFAYQMGTAKNRGTGFGGRYIRRIIGLFVLGLLHVAFLFQGDILVIYAILGSLLFLFRNAKPKTLVKWGIGVYSAQILVIALMALGMSMGFKYAPDDMAEMVTDMANKAEHSRQVFGGGSFMESIPLRFAEWTEVISFGMFMQGIGAFAFFLFGLAAVRSDLIANPGAAIWGRFRKIYLPVGIIGSAVAAYLLIGAKTMMGPQMMLGMFLLTLFSPFSTAGYLGLIAWWAERPMAGFKRFMARGGTATLTAYLMQGLLLSLIFNAYGLGYFTKLGAAASIAIAFAVALFTICFASLWRTKFNRGPLEMLLRSWTYLGQR